MSFLERLIPALLIVLACAATGPRRDPAFQVPIEQAVESIVRQDDAAVARFETLRGLGVGRRAELLLQLALYLETATGTEQSMGGALIVRQLAFTPDEKLDAVLPRLPEAGPNLRRVFTELLSTIDRPEGGDPDFLVYEERIRTDKAGSTDALILYMYEVSPEAALAAMERVHGSAARNGAASRSVESIDRMSRDAAWWRRLYAAAVLRERPDLATPGIASRLRNDTHPLVRRAATDD
ncbi:MAG: hypothetical protein ACREAA_13075 [Candidatus Polarisedimenticolia bacterium]